MQLKSFFKKTAAKLNGIQLNDHQRQIGRLLAIGLATVTASTAAHALSLPFLNNIGCQIYNFLVGELAIWAFILIAAGTLLLGLVAKIDFSKLLGAVIIFGILQGLAGLLVSTSPSLQATSCLSTASGGNTVY